MIADKEEIIYSLKKSVNELEDIIKEPILVRCILKTKILSRYGKS